MRGNQAVASTRRAYQNHDIADAVTEKAPITAGPYAGMFDFAVSNGRVVQLVQCWSFQLPNQTELADQVKAWAWVVRGLRDHGGQVRIEEREIDVPAGDIDVVSVYVPPEEGQEAPAFDEARAAFEETDVHALTPDEADIVGERAAELLHVSA